MQKLIFHIKYAEDRVEQILNASSVLNFTLELITPEDLLHVPKRYKVKCFAHFTRASKFEVTEMKKLLFLLSWPKSIPSNVAVGQFCSCEIVLLKPVLYPFVGG